MVFLLAWIGLDGGGRWWAGFVSLHHRDGGQDLFLCIIGMVGRILLSSSGHLNARIAKLALNGKKANRWKLIWWSFSSIIIRLETLRKGILGAESCVGIYILDKSVRQLSRRSRITFTLDHLHCSPPLSSYKDLTILRDSKTRRHMQSCRKICTLDQQSSNLQTNENMKSSCKQKSKNT